MAEPPSRGRSLREQHITNGGRAGHRRRIAAAFLLVAFGPHCGEESAAPAGAPAPPRLVACSPEVTRLLVALGVDHAIAATDSLSIPEVPVAAPLDLGPGCANALHAPGIAPALAILLGGPGVGALAAGLAERGVETLVLEPRSANEVAAAHHRVAARLGIAERGTQSVARLTREISAIATRRDGLPRLSAVWIVARAPLVAVGSGGMLHEILELAGAENAFHGSSEERREIRAAEIAESAPDLVLDSSGGSEPLPLPPDLRVLRIAPHLATLPALDLTARVRALHEELYPEPAGPRHAAPSPPLPR